MATENANIPDHTWETSKENVKPIKTGRKVKGLQIRSGPDDQISLQLQTDKWEEELKAADTDSDPLAYWIRYLSWIRQTYPSDSSKTMLLLERCTEHFKTTEQYKNDPRYIKLWIEYADLVPTPGEIFAFLQSNKIGEKVALFWIAWAFVAEKHENFTLTDKIFQKGINKRAEPRDTLQHRYQQFQRRMARFYLNQSNAAAETGQAAGQTAAPEEASRRALGKLSRTQAAGSSGSRAAPVSSTQPQSGGLGTRTQAANALGFDIFTDAHADSAVVSSSSVAASAQLTENKHWTKLATQEAVRKENDAPVERFADTAPIGSAVTTRRGAGPALRPDEIFVEPAFEEAFEPHYESDDDVPGPNIRRQLDSHVLAAHSAPSEQEKLMKDPLAKHKQGEGVVVPAPPAKQSSSSSSRDKDRAKRPPQENDRAQQVAMPPPSAGTGFTIFSDTPTSKEEPKTSKSKPVEAQTGASGSENKRNIDTKSASSKKSNNPLGFDIFCDNTMSETVKPEVKPIVASEERRSGKRSKEIAPKESASTTKSSALGFDIFCDAGDSKPKESSARKPAMKPKEKPQQSINVFDDFDMDLEEAAPDDQTINTKIAKMDIDAMFFDVEESAPMPPARPLDLNASSSFVFPAAGSIADTRQQHLSTIPESASKKDGGFVVFDEFSVIRSDSMHRSHEVSAESPYSNYGSSPQFPSGVLSARRSKKRSLSAESDELRVPAGKMPRADAAAAAPSNSLYLSASSDSSNGELDSMQYSLQPTRPLQTGGVKSKSSLPFKVYED